MKTILLGLVILVLLVAAAWAMAPRREIVTEVEIAAPPERVWSVLTDAAKYPEWNPFIVSMQGDIQPGATLTNEMRPQAGSPMTFRPVVLRAEPDRELRWLGTLGFPRIFDGENYFLLNPSPEGTRLVHGERFRGIALWVIDPEQFRADFEALNAALKARAEGAN